MLGSNEKHTQDVAVGGAILSAIPAGERWNRNLPEFKRLTEQYGPECRAFIAAEAKRRGYEYDRDLKAYRVPWKMFALRGRNVIAAGWQDGMLRVAFAGKDGAKFWRYKGVPEAEFEKLKRVPYPDKLFTTNIKNKGFKATKE